MKKFLLALFAFIAFSGMAIAAVNLNTASKSELETVKGIGPQKAEAILDYRKKNGPFKTVDDLKKVSGFGDKSVAKKAGKSTEDKPKTDKSKANESSKK